jgi:AraC-like DNA-binding protein
VTLLEPLARGAASGVLFALAVAVGRGGPSPARVTGSLFCLSASAHVLQQNPAVLFAMGPAAWPLVWLSMPGAGLLWAFARELFEDNRRIDLRRFLPAAGLAAVGAIALAAGDGSLARSIWLVHKLASAALMAHVLFIVLAGWRGDLVERRRRLRGPILALPALYTMAVNLVEAAALFGTPVQALSPVAAADVLVMSLAGAAVFLQADPELFGAARRARSPEPSASAQDLAVLAKLRKALDEDQVWRREALSIGELASVVGAPEHRLRRLINAQLGYRNFAAFLNERRIAAAKRALADPAHALTPVSQIAYEAGFGSLGPFNRAFKDATGSTPSAWREAQLSGSPILQTTG